MFLDLSPLKDIVIIVFFFAWGAVPRYE